MFVKHSSLLICLPWQWTFYQHREHQEPPPWWAASWRLRRTSASERRPVTRRKYCRARRCHCRHRGQGRMGRQGWSFRLLEKLDLKTSLQVNSKCDFNWSWFNTLENLDAYIFWHLIPYRGRHWNSTQIVYTDLIRFSLTVMKLVHKIWIKFQLRPWRKIQKPCRSIWSIDHREWYFLQQLNAFENSQLWKINIDVYLYYFFTF